MAHFYISIYTYDVYKTDKKQFISLVKDQIRAVKEKKPYWQGLNVWELEECLAQQKICLISGEGGIGKTYFIKKFEEELEIRKIEHLCIYGKYEKSINNIDFEEISKIAVDKRFVFVVDALNEMPETCQGELIEKIEKIKALKGMQCVITYRT